LQIELNEYFALTKLLTDISGFQLRMYVYYYHNIEPVN